MLTRVNCSGVNSSRSVVLTLPKITLRIELLSLTTRSVKIRPTVVRSLYQPITSVSLVDKSRADIIRSRTLSLSSGPLGLATSNNVSRKGFLERSVLLRSTAMVRLNVSSFRTSRAPDIHPSRGSTGLELFSMRSRVTTDSSLDKYLAVSLAVTDDGPQPALIVSFYAEIRATSALRNSDLQNFGKQGMRMGF